MVGFTLRSAVAADGRFLADMAVEAGNWRPNSHRPRTQLLADPIYLGYVTGWQRPADRGIIAVDEDGEPVGAAWYRLFNQDTPGQAYIATGVPELIVGVKPLWRAQGVGRALIQALCRLAAAEGRARIALSVDRDNYALALYRSEGFTTVYSGESRDTMVKHLR